MSAASERRQAEREAREALIAHLTDDHGQPPYRAGLTDLQLSHSHAVAHLSEADRLHVTSRITGRIGR